MAGRTCVFCGSDDMSKEHIWPDWLSNVLPADEPHDHKLTRREQGTRIWVADFSQKPYRLRVGCVCKACNNGWMSAIESAVKPYVEPLIQGRGRQLHTFAQGLIARWAILKALVFDRMAKPEQQSIVPRFYEAFYDARNSDMLPACFEVFAASYAGERINGIVTTQVIDFRPNEQPHPDSPLGKQDVFSAIFSVGALVLQVFGRDEDGVYEWQHHKRMKQAVCRVWPPQKKPLVFPPRTRLSDSGLEVLMRDKLV
jgi:hypothetical protein